MDRISHYRIVRKIGAGGMGEVWRAVDERLGRDVAIKLLGRGRASPQRALRMLREAQAASGLNHPGIVTVHDIGEIDGHPYLVMELVEGRRFSELGRVAPEEALRLCALAADALGAAHERGILHRDVKTDNLMCLPDGRVKVLDFGLAKVIGGSSSSSDARAAQTDEEPVTPVSGMASTVAGSGDADAEPEAAASTAAEPNVALAETMTSTPPRTPLTPGTELTRVGDIVGTPAYMAPEQARGEQVDARAEIFSLGVVLYELLVGRRPFLGGDIEHTLELVRKAQFTPPSQATEAPALVPLDPVVARALAKDPAARYRDMREMASALRRAGDALVHPRRPRSVARLAIVVGAGAVALGVAGYVIATRGHRGGDGSGSARAPAPAFAIDTSSALTQEEGCSEFPSLSADAGFVVYDAMIGGDTRLELIDATHKRRELTHGPGWDLAPALAPDAKSVAYLHKHDGPYETRVSGIDFAAPPRTIAQGGMRPAWSPDGTSLWAGSGRKPTRWSIETGKAERTLVVPAGLALLLPLELPDGSVAGVMLRPDEAAEPIGVALFPPAGDMRWLYQGEVDEVLARAPDGRLVASRITGRKRELVALAPGGAPPVSLGLPMIDARKGLSSSSDGSVLVWSDCTNHNDVALVARVGERYSFAPITGGDWADVDPAPVADRRQLVVVSDRGDQPEPWLIDLDGGTPARRIAQTEVTRMSVTPDGKTLVYSVGGETIHKVALDGASPPVKLADGGGDGTPAASPDGRVYFERVEDNVPRVYTVPLAGGPAQPALPPGSAAAAPSPVDARLIYARGRPGEQRLVVRELRTGKERELAAELPAGGPWHVRFSADGARAVANLGAGDVFVVDVAAGKLIDHVVGSARTFIGAALVGPHGETLVVGETWWRGSVWQGGSQTARGP